MINCEFENGNKASLRHVVVDNLVLKDGKILLVKRTGKLLEGGKWGLAGGYVDRDETVKEAAKREILEETGYTKWKRSPYCALSMRRTDLPKTGKI